MSPEKPSLDALRIDDAARSGRGRTARWLLVLLLVAAGMAAAYAWRLRGGAAVPVRVVAVVESAGAEEAGQVVLNGSGYVTARRRATVSSKVTGKVVEVNVEEGMSVKAGQVLARLDDATVKAHLAVAEAELEAARSSLEETRVRLSEARVELERTRKLAAEGIVNQADLVSAEATSDALAARLAAARRQVAVAEAQVALRQTDLEDTTIRAPFSGVAVSKDAQPGEMISPVSAGGGFTRTGICTIVDMQSLEIEVDVNESYIGRISPGQSVEATLDAYPDWRIPARVITTVPTADRQKATVLVRIGFEQLDPRILPDMGVKVAFLGARPAEGSRAPARPRLLVPSSALVTGNGQQYVFVVRDGVAVRRPVRTGTPEGDGVEVVSGLAANENVIVNPPEGLADGQRVHVTSGGPMP